MRALVLLLLLALAADAQAFWDLADGRWRPAPALLTAAPGTQATVPLPDGDCSARLTRRARTPLGRDWVGGRLLPPCRGAWGLLHGDSGWQGWIGPWRLRDGHLEPQDGPRPQGADTLPAPGPAYRPHLLARAAPQTTPRALATEIRVLVLASASYAGRYPGTALTERIDALFALANQGLADSGVALTFVPDPAPDPIDLPDTVSDAQALDDLRAGRPPFDAVAALRDAREADLVVLLRPLTDGRGALCGQAYRNGAGGTPLDPDLAFAVVRLERDAQGFLCPDLALPHMLGHLLGLVHDPDNAPQAGALPYAHGYGEAGLFGTVMSEIAPWINRWSSPDQTCNGRPCGLPDVADNVRALALLAPRAAAFRGPVQPPGTPAVRTDPASAIGPDRATLHGAIDPAGNAVRAVFRYGTDLTLADETAPQDLPAVHGEVPVSVDITGLTCDTRYLYRLEARTGTQTLAGLNGQFTTAPCDTPPPGGPPEPPAPKVSGVGRGSAILTVTLDPPGEPLQVRFQYGRDGAFDRLTDPQAVDAGAGTTQVSRFIGGLDCATPYQARVLLERADGTRLLGPATAFTTLACASAAADVVTLEPLDVQADRARLAGQVDPGGVPTLVWFEYGPPQNPALHRTPALNIGQGTRPKTVTHDLLDLDCATPYAYRVVAATDDGSGAGVDPRPGETVPFTTLDCPLPEVRDERLVWANAHDAVVAATVDTQGRDGEVVVQYGLSPGYGEFSERLPVQGLTYQVPLTGLDCGTLYYYRFVVTVGTRVVTGAGDNFATAPCPDLPEVATVPEAEVTATSAALRARVLPNGAPTRLWFEYGPDTGYGQVSPARRLAADSPGEEPEIWVLELDCGATYHFRAVAENTLGRVTGEDATFTTAPCRPPAQPPPPRLDGGGAQTLAIGADGLARAWGDGDPVPRLLAAPGKAARVAAGDGFALVLDRAGRLWTWGAGERGQLGDGTLEDRDAPQPVAEDVRTAAAGGAHVLALDGRGGLLAWGANDRGQLGDGTFEDRPAPVTVDLGVAVTAVAAGTAHSLAVDERGRLWVWGDNRRGQLGARDAERVPRPRLGPLDHVRAVAAGAAFSLALRSDGTVWVWGAGDRGQLGDGSFADRAEPRPLRDADGRLIDDAVAIAAGAAHALLLRADGTVWAWGANDRGQAGIPGGEDQPHPQAVNGPAAPLRGLLGVAAGAAHSLALAGDGGVWGWGDGALGQLGPAALGGPVPARLADAGGPLRLAASRLVVTPPDPVLEEGGTLEIQVRLDGEPLAPLFVSARIDDERGLVTLADPRPQAVDAETWERPLTLVLESIPDADARDDTVDLVLAAPGLGETRIPVRVRDRDAAPARAAWDVLALVVLIALQQMRGRGSPRGGSRRRSPP